MEAYFLNFYQKYKYGLPFLILFLTALFLPTAGNRMVFYLLSPFLIFCLYRFRHELGPYVKTWSFAALSVYLFYFSLTFLWSDLHSFGDFLRLLRDGLSILVFTFSLAVLLPKINLPERLPVYFAWVCLVWAAVATGYCYLWEDHGLSFRLVGFGRFENSIHMALFLSIAIIGLFTFSVTKAPLAQRDVLLFVFLIFSILFLIALTQARSAYVALAACVFIMFFLGNVRFLGVIVLGTMASIFGLYVFSDRYMSSFIGRMDSYRFEIWKDAWEAIREKPLLGHGISTEPEFFLEANDSKRGWKSPHNVILGHLYTGGVLGLLVFAGLVVVMCRVSISQYLREMREKKRASFITLFTGLVICFGLTASLINFSHYLIGVYIHWLVFWLPFTLVWFLEVQQRKECA